MTASIIRQNSEITNSNLQNTGTTSDSPTNEIPNVKPHRPCKNVFENSNNIDWSIQKPKFAKSKISEELILGLVKEAEIRESKGIDLSKKELTKIPQELLQLSQLQRLVLESNDIKELPEALFDRLCNLSWLDLRFNKLHILPSIYIGRHKHLRTLLLQGNCLKTLPLELGLVKTLNGLNISENPLQFPPSDIIAKGTQSILCFLREVLDAKSQERKRLLFKETASRDGDGDNKQIQQFYTTDTLPTSTSSATFTTSHLTDPVDSVNGMRTEQKEEHIAENEPEIATTTFIRRPSPSKAYRKNKSQICTTDNQDSLTRSPSSCNYLTFKMAEEQNAAKYRDYKIKEEAILQRRRDQQILRQWRDESRTLQEKRRIQVTQARQGGTYEENTIVSEQAPYGIDQDHMKIMNTTERIKEDVRLSHERLRTRKLLKDKRILTDEEQIHKIQEVERQIKAHTKKMYERRKNPKLNVYEEVQAAKLDLETAKALQLELVLRRRKFYNTCDAHPFS